MRPFCGILLLCRPPDKRHLHFKQKGSGLCVAQTSAHVCLRAHQISQLRVTLL